MTALASSALTAEQLLAMMPASERATLIARLARERLPERLWSKITEITPDGCWEWTAAKTSCGYGRIKWGDRVMMAHRVVYTLLVGPIPGGLTIDHLCRNPGCVNPAHMEPVTLLENVQRGEGVGVRNSAKTHCPRGHEYTPENTYMQRNVSGKPRRVCKICQNAANQRVRDRKKQQA